MTDDDTQLLERAAKQFKATRKQLEALVAENAKLREENKALRTRNASLKAAKDRAETDRKLLRARLMQPDALNAQLWRDRADYYQEEARVLKLANSPASGGGEQKRGDCCQ
jgi:regulator of replication initiation timing